MNVKFLKASNGDCILVSFVYSSNKPINILIDGGVRATYIARLNKSGDLKREIESIRDKNELIDLLILTHIDNDHICGLLRWFELDADAYKLVKKVWFNSGKLIAEYLKQPENPDLTVDLVIPQDTYTGVPEALDFENYLNEKKIWDRRIIKFDKVPYENGYQIQVLSPTKNKLEMLLKEFKKVTESSAFTAAKVKDWNSDIKSFIEEENSTSYEFESEKRIENGSSISIILTVKDEKYLFLGDSQPDDIVKSLKVLGYRKDNPVEVVLMKLSHHGSKGNTSRELLELVRTDNYIISTDSSGHGHPDKRTLARIIHANPKAVFHFNYEHVQRDIFSANDHLEFTQFKAIFTTDFMC